jgi:hypothetical protein
VPRVEVSGGPLDGLSLTTSLPILDHYWIDPVRKMCFRKERKGTHLYRLRACTNGWRLVDYAGHNERICSQCSAYHQATEENVCSLCGGALRLVA